MRKSQEKVIETRRKKLGNLTDLAKIQTESEAIANMEAGLPEVPAIPRIFANDVTPEALANLLHAHGNRFAVFSDEAGILTNLAGLYSGGQANVDVVLKGIDGSPMRVNRKDREVDLNPYLTFCLTFQPSILEKVAQKSTFEGNGFWERFLYMVPASNLGTRTHDKEPLPETIKCAYRTIIRQLLDGFNEQAEEPTVLQLNVYAYDLWKEFEQRVERDMRPIGKLAPYSGWGSKMRGYCLRIAGLLHIGERQDGVIISVDVMQRAIALSEFLIEHGILAFTND